MDYGMPTLIEINDIEETAKLCSELGLNFIEINMNLPQYQFKSDEFIEKLKGIAKEYNIYYTIHLEEELDVCNFNRIIKQAWIDSIVDSLRMAKQLNIRLLNMHLSKGVYFTLPTEKVFLYSKNQEQYLQDICEFRDVCDEELNDTDVVITIENTSGYTEFQKKAIDELLKSKHFALCWDIGHSLSHTEDEEYIEEKIDSLAHMHLHDGEGKKNHLELGTGRVDILNKIQIAQKHKCRCVIEVKTIESLKKSVEWLKNKKR